MFYNSLKKGFTLLELLIVIAIIGILSAIGLSYMNQSRGSGEDSNVRQNLVNARSKAALFFAENASSYEGVCINTNIRNMVQSAARATGITPKSTAYADGDVGDWDTEVCHDSTVGYAIWVPSSDSTSAVPAAWCVDSTGTSTKRTGTSLGDSDVTC